MGWSARAALLQKFPPTKSTPRATRRLAASTSPWGLHLSSSKTRATWLACPPATSPPRSLRRRAASSAPSLTSFPSLAATPVRGRTNPMVRRSRGAAGRAAGIPPRRRRAATASAASLQRSFGSSVMGLPPFRRVDQSDELGRWCGLLRDGPSDEASAGTGGGETAVGKDRLAAEEGADGPPSDPHSLEGRVVLGRVEELGGHHLFPVKVHEREVGIGPDEEGTLLRVEGEGPGGVGAHELRDALERDPAPVEALREHDRVEEGGPAEARESGPQVRPLGLLHAAG